MKRSLILPALLALSACGDSPSELKAKAEAAFAAHQYNAARLHIAELLSSQPGDRDLLLLQARTLIALGDGNGAGSALAKLAGQGAPGGELAELSAEAALLRNSPDRALEALGATASPEAERLRALAAIQQNRLAEAGDHFAKAVALGGNARAFADYARYRLLAGDVAGAQEMAARARQVAPDGLDTLLVDGQLAVRGGDLARALATYTRAGELYPESLAALTGKAAVLGDLGRLDEMKQAVDRAATFAPKDPTVAYLRARGAAAAKDWAGVRGIVQPMEADLPQQHPMRLLYGEALLRLGQNELAIAQIGPIARMQGNRDAVRLLAETQLAAGDARAAVQTVQALAGQPSARREELELAVRAAKAAGDPRLAQWEARLRAPAVQALGQDLADADIAMQKGNWAGAVQAYERVFAVTDGNNVMVLNNMAYAQLMLGNHAKANQYAQRALKLAPDNPSVMDTAAIALLRSGGDREQAKRLLRSAAEKAPGNLTIRAHLAEAERPPG